MKVQLIMDFTEDLILFYFNAGEKYSEILSRLNDHHGIHISLRTLKTYIKDLGLKRQNKYTDEECLTLVQETIQNSPCSNLGYRLLRLRIQLLHGITLTMRQVETSLRRLDPNGVATRGARRLQRRIYAVRAPNCSQHLDGYDKLKRYGFSVYGSIDGYSRKLLTLSVLTSNKDPVQVAHTWLDGVEDNGGFPSRTVSDFGTETGFIGGIMATVAGPGSHRYTTSQHNQRIESFWSQLRRGGVTYLINYFSNLEFADVVDFSNDNELDIVRYSYMSFIQRELTLFKEMWNLHPIRVQRYSSVPAGVPNENHIGHAEDGKIYCPPDILQVIRDGLPAIQNNFRTGVQEKDAAFLEALVVMGLHPNPTTLKDCEEIFFSLKRYFGI